MKISSAGLISPMSRQQGKPYLDFDINALKHLKEIYTKNLVFIQESLPDVPLKSPKKLVVFFHETLDLDIPNAKISTLSPLLEQYDHDSFHFDTINGIVTYLRLKYCLKNYINWILTFHENGRVYLRDYQGAWCLPNRRPKPKAPELIACIQAEGIEL